LRHDTGFQRLLAAAQSSDGLRRFAFLGNHLFAIPHKSQDSSAFRLVEYALGNRPNAPGAAMEIVNRFYVLHDTPR
jgi:hypothetical protein